MRHHLILFFIPLILWTNTTRAQEDENLVRASFRTLPVLSANWTGIFYQPEPDGEMVEIFFNSLSRSFMTYEYSGPKSMRFYRENGLDEKGEMTYRTIASVAVTSSEMLIFFKQNPKNVDESGPEFELLAIDDSPRALPIDHVAFVNMTGANFACRFSKNDMFLRPGLTGPISVADELNENLFIGLAVTNNTTQRLVLKNTWEFQGGNRHIILLLPPKKRGSFRIRAYRITEYVGENQRFNPKWTPPEIIESGPEPRL